MLLSPHPAAHGLNVIATSNSERLSGLGKLIPIHEFTVNLKLKRQTIAAAGSWRALPGFLYGLRQPALIGRLKIDADRQVDFAAVDSAILRLTADLAFDPPDGAGVEGLASRVARLVITLQNHFRIPVDAGHHVGEARPTTDGFLDIEIALPYHELRATRSVLAWVITTVNGMLDAEGENAANPSHCGTLAELGESVRTLAPPNNEVLNFLRAAYRQQIPVHRLVSNVFCFGTGCNMRLLDATVSDRTSEIGSKIARNKVLTAEVLRRAGLPASEHIVVATSDGAVSVAEQFGFPVVVKPINRRGGDGVFAGLRNARAVREAFAESRKFSEQLVVEKHFDGRDHRLTVFEGQVVKIEERVAAGIIGNGRASIAQLVAEKQASPRFQKLFRQKGRMVLSLDTEALGLLAEHGLTADSVLEADRYIPLRRKSNISVGAEHIEVPLESAHPDNLALATRAAELLRLDFAGVDLIIPDIALSWQEAGALICEVNSAPQIGVRTSPTLHDRILRELIGPTARIPAHLLIVADEDAQGADQSQELMADWGCNSVSTRTGVWIDGRRLVGNPNDSFSSARILLREKNARSALCVVTVGEILAKGLPIDWFDSIRLQAREQELQALLPALRPHTASLIEAAWDA